VDVLGVAVLELGAIDDEEARVAIGTSEKLVMTVAGQLGLAEELRGVGAAAARAPAPPTAVIPFRSP